MTTVEQARTGPRSGPVVRVTAGTGALALAVGAVATWAEARWSGDDEYLTSDLVGITVFAVAGVVVVALLDVWALHGGATRVRRVVVGSAVAAVVVLPLMWWNAVPVVLAASVLALASRPGREGSPRWAHLVAVLVIAVVVALWTGSTVAGLL